MTPFVSRIRISKASKRRGLTVKKRKEKKTEVMVIMKKQTKTKQESPRNTIQVEGRLLKHVDQFSYLSSLEA